MMFFRKQNIFIQLKYVTIRKEREERGREEGEGRKKGWGRKG